MPEPKPTPEAIKSVVDACEGSVAYYAWTSFQPDRAATWRLAAKLLREYAAAEAKPPQPGTATAEQIRQWFEKAAEKPWEDGYIGRRWVKDLANEIAERTVKLLTPQPPQQEG